jgi:hypothetical protein
LGSPSWPAEQWVQIDPRSVAIGWWRTPSTEDRGDESTPSWRSRIIQIVVGLLLIAGGIVLVAMST